MKKAVINLFIFAGVSLSAYANAEDFASLAIDKKDGSAYGWSYDQKSLTAAEQRALQECNKRSSNNQCSVVLAWSGEGCGAYRTVEGRVGTAYGWGVASTKNTANEIANREALKRSNGVITPNYVWACNTTDKNPLKVIKGGDSEVKTVNIGSQVWMAENLSASKFRNGDPIPLARNDDTWASTARNRTPISRIVEDNPAKEKKYGRFYNRYAAADPRGICPIGFRVPTKEDFDILKKTIGSDPRAGNKLKSKTEWKENRGTDNYGFNALPVGYVYPYDGRFSGEGTLAFFTTITPYNKEYHYYAELMNREGSLHDLNIGAGAKPFAGYSVRCIQD